MQIVEVSTLDHWLKADEAVLVDVREPAEHRSQRIPQASLWPLSRFDPSALAPPSGKRLVMHCKAGLRSMQACERWEAAHPGHDAYSLKGGIDAWHAAGLPTQHDEAGTIDLQRQVQLTIGSMLLIGTALGVWVNPWWLVIPAFLGLGLTFAGATGTCGLAMVLAKMPWNR